MRSGRLVLTVGPELSVRSSLDKVTFSSPYGVNLPPYPEVTKRYAFSDFREQHVSYGVALPVLVGGEWNAFFLMGGVKIAYAYTSYAQRGRLTTSIYDEWAMDEWTDDATLGLGTGPYKVSGRVGSSLSAVGSLELGLVLNEVMPYGWQQANNKRQYPLKLRLSLFADYGYPLVRPAASGAMVTATPESVMTRSLYTSDYLSSRPGDLLVGVKLLAAIQMNKPVAKRRPSTPPVHRPTTPPAPPEPKEEPTVETPSSSVTPESNIIMATSPRTYIITNLFFAFNETRILPTSGPALMELYEMLKENPTMRVRLIGHTDSIGSDENNMKLSKGRAESIRQNMIRRGIDASRIEIDGRGESEPIATNETEEGRAQNRRVEMQVLSE